MEATIFMRKQVMTDLWTKEKEIQFFEESTNFATPEQLFYVGDDFRYYAYWPKSYRGKKSTLQSRNALIGSFTEKYSVDLLQDFANSQGLYKDLKWVKVILDELEQKQVLLGYLVELAMIQQSFMKADCTKE